MKRNVTKALARRMANRIHGFARAEDGLMAPMIIIFFFLMIVLGGIAVDVMRFETKRVTVQNTLDRAALAVANMNSALTIDNVYTTKQARAERIVEDYFTKAGVIEYLKSVHLDEGANYRTVRVEADVTSRNIFMYLVGTPELATATGSIAEQRITDIEIMLVLDISGSMGGSKIAALKVAANNFIDQVKADDDENRISIGVIPYNAQVNLGGALASKYNLTNAHGMAYSNCVEIPIGTELNNMFTSLALSRTTEMPLMSTVDHQSTSNTSNVYVPYSDPAARPADSAAYRWCNPTPTSEITLPTKNANEAKAGINAMRAEGNTSILLGMRWATALLDPSARGIYDELRQDGFLHADMVGRPYNYNNPNDGAAEALKIIVLMTDGEHVAHKRIRGTDAPPTASNPNYKTGNATISFTYSNLSNQNVATTATIWRANATSGDFSVFFSHRVNAGNICGSRPYYVPRTDKWQSVPEGLSPTTCYDPNRMFFPGDPVVVQWQNLWNNFRMAWVVRQLIARPLGESNTNKRQAIYTTVAGILFNNSVNTYATNTEMDNRLASNCRAARTAGVVVYGIAFQAPTNGRAAIRNCASIPDTTYYFDVTETSRINDAFRMIASNLSALRLTQ
ncbi:TadE/TadG family protein [Xinfangfangia sp. D13-10-4-6]|uniref:TadE/TadG family type IV pilus assembly protein n=1 Tax=Pseudogemmobacter hezensis TaxID=2737662 RepID=UPI0015577AC3|nr:TadE/TadG family type IV pilus assembly protein [Pseudogemmobacter hezensis]NPD13967.1 TadE/TadG family protein [Pseudogemmobacter hezensis]